VFGLVLTFMIGY